MDKSLHYLAMANQQLIQKQLLERVKSAGLTLGQPKVLDFLKDHDGASQKDIAAGCFIEAGSLTSILNGMEKKGLIERRMLNGNRRTFHIFMTEAGKKSQGLVDAAFQEIEETALEGISREELEKFMKVSEKIFDNLMESWCDSKVLQRKKDVTNEDTEKICDFSDRAFCKLPWSQPDYKSQSGNFTDFVDPLCFESQFPFYAG